MSGAATPLEAAFFYEKRAIEIWGDQAQTLMVCEEAGELVTALAQFHRKRATADEVLDEAADAIIMSCCAVAIVGHDIGDLHRALQAKLDRLRNRIFDHDRKTDNAAIAAKHEGPVT